jgi:hypothetical protein
VAKKVGSRQIPLRSLYFPIILDFSGYALRRQRPHATAGCNEQPAHQSPPAPADISRKGPGVTYIMVADSRAKATHSQIPVMTARPPQSSLPTSLSTPQLGLVPQGRYLAVSGSPTYPPVSGTTPVTHTSNGLIPFRSFRNLLPFGPGKNTSATPARSTGTALPTRTSLGTLRRSGNGESIVPTSSLPSAKCEEEPPVLSIELSRGADEPLFDANEFHYQLATESSTPDTVSPSPISSIGSLNIIEQRVYPYQLFVALLISHVHSPNHRV